MTIANQRMIVSGTLDNTGTYMPSIYIASPADTPIPWITPNDGYTYTVTGVSAYWTTADSSGTPTVQVRRMQGVEAVASGDALLSAAIDLTGTAETVVNGSLVTGDALTLAAGDRLGVDVIDAVTEAAGLTVAVTIAKT